MEPVLTLTDAPSPADIAFIDDGLNAFNDAITPPDRRPLAVIVRDPVTGATLGGLHGRTSLGTLFINMFFLDASLRGRDIGTRAIAMAEAEARRRGCITALLFTITIQAPGFYERMGYTKFGEVACLPPGTARVFFSKSLTPSGVPDGSE